MLRKFIVISSCVGVSNDLIEGYFDTIEEAQNYIRKQSDTRPSEFFVFEEKISYMRGWMKS